MLHGVYPVNVSVPQQMCERLREPRVFVAGVLNANNGEIMCDAAPHALGVIFQLAFLVCEALRTGQLVRVVKNWQTDESNICAIYPNLRFLPPKVRSFIDLLIERFGPKPN